MEGALVTICLLKINKPLRVEDGVIYPYFFPSRPLNSNATQMLNGGTGVLIYTGISNYKATSINFHGIMKVQNGCTH